MKGDTTGSVAVEGRVADAPPGNWVDRFAPAALRPYLRLSRIDRPIGTWLLLLPCWWGLGLAIVAGGDGPAIWDLWIAVGCGLGAVLMRGSGCTWNDLTDRNIDAAVARTRSRPLPSGQVTPRQAMFWLVLQALLAFAILLTFPPAAIALGFGSLALVAIYPFAKRFTWWPQIYLGLAFNWGAVLAWAAHGSALTAAPLLLYGAGIVWTLFYDTIYAHQDREDDALIGVKSTARLFGADTRHWLAGFIAACAALIAAAIWQAHPAPAALLIAGAGAAGFIAHLIWQWRHLDIGSPAACLALFKSNREAGLILALGLFLATML